VTRNSETARMMITVEKAIDKENQKGFFKHTSVAYALANSVNVEITEEMRA